MSTDDNGHIEIALVVSAGLLRTILNPLSADRGRRFWVASHPVDALEEGAVTIGFGVRGCSDALNRTFFRIPIIDGNPSSDPDRLLLLFDASVITCDEVGYYLEEGRFVRDEVSNFQEFFATVQDALVKRLLGPASCRKEDR